MAFLDIAYSALGGLFAALKLHYTVLSGFISPYLLRDLLLAIYGRGTCYISAGLFAAYSDTIARLFMVRLG